MDAQKHHSFNEADSSTHGRKCRCEDMNGAAPSTHGTRVSEHGTMNEAAPSTHEREDE